MNNSWAVFTQEWGTALIGIFVVFTSLVIMIVILELIAKIVSKIESANNTKKDTQEKERANQKESSDTKTPIIEEQQAKSQDDLELIAVISAAIAASLGTSSDQLVVRSLRKVERKTR